VHLMSVEDSNSLVLPAGIDPAALPPLVVSPELNNGLWYRGYIGAYERRAQAESLRATLASRGLIGSASGVVERTPLALLLADSVRAVDVPTRLQALARRGVRAYPLARGDGLVALYAGAFRTEAEAAYLARTLQKAGVPARLVYRIGRSL